MSCCSLTLPIDRPCSADTVYESVVPVKYSLRLGTTIAWAGGHLNARRLGSEPVLGVGRPSRKSRSYLRTAAERAHSDSLTLRCQFTSPLIQRAACQRWRGRPLSRSATRRTLAGSTSRGLSNLPKYCQTSPLNGLRRMRRSTTEPGKGSTTH